MLLQYNPKIVLTFTDDEIERFWSRMIEVDRGHETPCWEWQGSIMLNGYGRLIKGNKHYYIHRLSYILANGPLGDLHALHHCDNRSCGNPDHIYAGTEQDNANDKVARGRTNHHGGIPVRGELNKLAKLTESDVRAIRNAAASGARGVDLAAQFGVWPSNISAIVQRQTWKHIE